MAYSYTRTLTSDGSLVPSTLTDFTALFSLTDDQLKTTANGGKIRNTDGGLPADFDIFSDSGLTTGLNFKVISYNASTGAILGWVKIPSLAGTTDTTIYLAYGDPAVTTYQGNDTGIYDSSIIAHYELGDGSTLSASDNSANARHGTLVNTPVAATGKIDGCADLESGSSQHITLPAWTIVAQFTWSAWIRLESLSAMQAIIERDSSGGGRVNFQVDTGGKLHCRIDVPFSGTDAGYGATGTFTLSTATWYRVTLVGDDATFPSSCKGYVNGALDDAGTTVNFDWDKTSGPLTIGATAQGSPDTFLDGLIDDVMMNAAVRTADWLLTEYRNQNDPAAFWTLGDSEDDPFDRTQEEIAAGSEEVEYLLEGSQGFTITETAGASDSVTFALSGDFGLTLTETAAATEEVEFALSRAMAITVEDGARGDDALTLAGAQAPYGPSMVVLKHYYLEDGRLGYSSRMVIAPSHSHEGRVTMFGTAEREIPIPPGPPRIGNMTTELADTDQAFRIRFGNRTPRFRRSDTLIGPEGGKESLFIIPFAGVVDSVTFPPGKVVTEEVDNRFRWLRKSIPPLCIVENFPDIPQASRGRFFPILFGRVSSAGRGDQGAVELIHVDTVQHRYAVNRSTTEDVTVYTKGPTDAEFTIVSSGWSKVEENQTINGVDYTLCYVQFDSALPEGTIVRGDVDGVNFRGGWGLFAPISGLLQNPIDALVNLLYLIEQTENFQNNYDVQSFAEVRELCEDLGYLCDWPITEELTYEAAITQLVTSFGIDIFPSMRDQLKVALTAVVPTDRHVFTDELHIERESELITLASPTRNRFRYQFGKLPAEQRYAEERVYDNETDQATLANEFTDGIEEEVLELPAIADETTALAVVLERSSWMDQSSHRIRVRIGAPPNLLKIDLARIVGITHYGGLQEGGWVNEPFKIYRVALNLENLEYEVDMIKRVQPPLPPESSLVLVGQWRWNSRVGPFYLSNSKRVFTIMGDTRNDFYSLVAQGTPSVGVGAMSILDDGEFPTLANVIESFDGVRFETKHYSVQQERNTGRVSFNIFNFTNSQWELTNEQVLASNSDGDCGVCICVRDDGADGEVLVIFQGDREFSSGASGVPGDTSGDYQRAYITRRISAGVWSTPQMIGDPNSMFSSPGGLIPGLDYNGAVHIRTGRAEVFPVTNNVMIAYGVVEPADVASTQDLWCQVYRTDNTLSDAFEFEYTGGGQFSNEFLVGDGCAFEYGGNRYVAMPIGKILAPYVAIWQDSTVPTMPTKVQITTVEIHADNYGAKMPDINVRWAQDKLHVINGTHLNSGAEEWATYKTISPPFTTVSPSSTAFPRADQIGPIWPANSLARTGSDVAVIAGQLRIFKLTSGHFDVPSSGGAYSIFESYAAEDDLPTAPTYDLADFIADHS